MQKKIKTCIKKIGRFFFGNKWRRLITCLLIIAILISLVSGCINRIRHHRDGDTETAEEITQDYPTMYTWSREENKEQIESYEWYTDTSYDLDKGNLSSELFCLPFGITDTYKSNNELLYVMEDGDAETYVNYAKSYLYLIYNQSFRDILEDQDGFSDTLDSYWYRSDRGISSQQGKDLLSMNVDELGEYFATEEAEESGTETAEIQSTEDTGEETESTETAEATEAAETTESLEDVEVEEEEGEDRSVVFSDLAQWYIDNKVIMTCDVATDTSMIFQDDYRYYVRCEIALTANTSDEGIKEFRDLYNMDLEKNKPVYYIVEIEIVPGSMQISGFNVIVKAAS
jgi:hypothetical protein